MDLPFNNIVEQTDQHVFNLSGKGLKIIFWRNQFHVNCYPSLTKECIK
jgi:hypothetical protein